MSSTSSGHRPLTEQTRVFWHIRTQRAVTPEDARRIARNASGFFRLLHEWAEREAHQTGSHSEAARAR